MAAEEQEETQQWCVANSAMQNRTYRFELVYPNGERTAMELERHPRDPKIRFYRGRTWSVRLLRTPDRYSGEIEETLEWTPVTPDDEGQPRLDAQGNMLVDVSNALVIDVRKDLAYIKRVLPAGETHTGIEFGFMNGNSQTFTGGLYYPENAMKRSLVRAFHQREAEVQAQAQGEEDAEVSTLNRHAHGREMSVGGGRIALDGTGSLVNQVYESAKISALIAFATSFFPLIGANPFVIGMAWTATTSAAWSGAVWALPIVVPSSIWSAVHSWRHERRELSMTASEKLFEKFSCHRMIGVCEGAELVGRNAILAFAGRPDRDILVPIGGDTDVITLEPLPPVVSWWHQVNNSGNIECIDRRIWSPRSL